MADDDTGTGEGDGPAAHLELEEGYRFRVDFGGDLPPLFVDEPEPLGAGSGPNASTLLAAAVADCLSASLLYCLERARVDVDGMHADVVMAKERNEAGRLRIGAIEVVLRPELEEGPSGRFDRCTRLFEDFCVVTESVRRGIDVTVRVEPATGSPSDAATPG